MTFLFLNNKKLNNYFATLEQWLELTHQRFSIMDI